MTNSPLSEVLSKEHRAHLIEGSGISQEVISGRGYRTIRETRELIELNYSRQQALNVPGILMPVHSIDGGESHLSVYRPDIPRVVVDKRKRLKTGEFKNRVIKYEVPKHAAIRLDCHPGVRGSLDQPGPLQDPSVRLWITEGVKKGDALWSRGEAALALLGVWNFKGRNQFGGVSVLADWHFVPLNDREVIIAFDSDLMQKYEIRRALEVLTEILQRKKAVVRRAYLPPDGTDKVGVDDYLKKHSIDELLACVEGPRPQIKAAAPILELLEDAPPTIRRPLSLIDGHAYMAAWPFIRKTITEIEEQGNVMRLSEPEIIEEQVMMIVRDDGKVFCDEGGSGLESLADLKIEVVLDELPAKDRLISGKAIKAYVQRRHPDPRQVFERITTCLNHFIDFNRCFATQQEMCEMLACYIMSTWFLPAFTVVGYMWPNGEAGAGKTYLMTLVAKLSYLGVVILKGGSYASLRDLADYGATIGFDDAENILDNHTENNADKLAMILAGNTRGVYIPVKEEKPGGGWRTRYIDNFGVRMFTAIRKPEGALATRTIVVPLIKTSDPLRGKRKPSNPRDWPFNEQEIVDDLWMIALKHLPSIPEHDVQASSKADLIGRILDPWRNILTVAHWLEAMGVKSLYDRVQGVMLSYQGEREEGESNDLTRIILRAVIALFCERCDVCDVCDVLSGDSTQFFTTKEIHAKCLKIVEDEEIPLKEEAMGKNRIGHILRRLRFTSGREPGTGRHGRQVTKSDLENYIVAYNLPYLKETSQTSQTSQTAPQKPAQMNLMEVVKL